MSVAVFKKVAASFHRPEETRCIGTALLCQGLLLGSWAALVRGQLAPGWFLLIGHCAYVRSFTAMHELSHTRRTQAPWRALGEWLLAIVHGPFQLGYEELAKTHRDHHAHPAEPRDPDAYLNTGPAWRALLHACTQPEQGFVRWILREGWSWRFGLRLLWHSAITFGLYWCGGPRGLVWWVVVTRLGCTSVWFIFDWVLHHPRCWGMRVLPLPGVLRLLWIPLFGWCNLDSTQHHLLHHTYPFVTGRELPRLSAWLASESHDTVALHE
jgi:fatty acid desaturase